MDNIRITTPAFDQSAAIADLLHLRRLRVVTDGTDACHTLIAGAAGNDTNTTLEIARKAGAKRVIIVDDQAATWSITDDLGGRVLRVGLPKTGLPPLADAGLLMLANLIAGPFGGMVAADPASAALIDIAQRVAKFDVSVFINGPTGSGKEVLSRMIHAASPRSGQPFVAINCAAIPENMLEAMLFGHEKGAFTGANAANKGYLRAADGGTLLLDEISEMPMALQAKLLRVLQEQVVTPLGSQTETAINVRVIATSNRDMDAEIARGTFRADLYYRLNVFPLETLPLQARMLDVPVLAQAFLQRHSRKLASTPLLSPDAISMLRAHPWHGNVRELENVMQRALVLADGQVITPAQIMLSTNAMVAALGRAA